MSAHKVELLEVWSDDHILCCSFLLDGQKKELYWVGWEGVAAVKYYSDSQAARELVHKLLIESEEVFETS